MPALTISCRKGLIDPEGRFTGGPLHGQHLRTANARSLRWLTVTRSAALSPDDIQLVRAELRRRYKCARANAQRSLMLLTGLPPGVRLSDLERIIQHGENTLRKRCRVKGTDSGPVVAAASFLRAHLVPVGKGVRS